MQEFIYLMLICCTEIRQVQQTLLSVFIVHFGSQLKCLLQNKLPKSSRLLPLLCQYNLSKLVHVLNFQVFAPASVAGSPELWSELFNAEFRNKRRKWRKLKNFIIAISRILRSSRIKVGSRLPAMQYLRALNHSFSRKDVKTPNSWLCLKLKFNLDYDRENWKCQCKMYVCRICLSCPESFWKTT